MPLQGDLKEMSLANLIQMNCQEVRTARLTLKQHHQTIDIFFSDGQVVHAENGTRSGIEVLYDAFAWNGGNFLLDNDVPAPAHTIRVPWAELLIEGMKRAGDRRAAPESLDGAALRSSAPSGAQPTPLLIELEKEFARLAAAAAQAGFKFCSMDPLALWKRSSLMRARVTQPRRRHLDLLASSAQSSKVVPALEQLGYQANQRFNSMYGARYLNFNEPSRQISVNVYLDAFEMYHRVDLGFVLVRNETVMTETGLALMRLQLVEMDDAGLNDLSALLFEHDLSVGYEAGKIDATEITRVCADDWGWYRTVTMNLDRLQEFVPRTMTRAEHTRVTDRIHRLRQGIETAAKSLRWQTRARIGESARWYETPLVVGSVHRPDMAIG